MKARAFTNKPEPSAVVRPPTALTRAPGALLQRMCACGSGTQATAECEECRKKKLLQRHATAPAPASAPSIVHDVLSSSGRPLDGGTRSFFEPRFGHDFSAVRIHDDPVAASSARAVNAHAYTVGEDIVFDSGKYAPQTPKGRELLAHELAHTVQQRGLQRSGNGVAMPGNAEDRRLEREAETMAAFVMSGQSPTALSQQSISRPTLSRVSKKKKNVPGLVRLEIPPDADPLHHEAFEVSEPFPLPSEKGDVLTLWDNVAKGGGLRASLDLKKAPRVDIKQDRPDLRAAWLSNFKWPDADKDQRWSDLAEKARNKKKAKGEKLLDAFPYVDNVACHMDHIIELQVFGGNEKENLQVLDPKPNMDSGRIIRKYLSDLGNKIKDTLEKDAPEAVLLIWRSVAQDGGAVSGENYPCCAIQSLAIKNTNADEAVPSKTSSEGLDVDRKAVRYMAKNSEILVPKKKEKTVPLRESNIVENRAVSRLINGLSLQEYDTKKKTNAISAVFDPEARLPFELEAKKGKGHGDQIHVDRGDDGELTVKPGKVKVPIHLTKLSEGAIENIRQENGEIAGDGYIIPSLPILKPMGKLGIAFTPNSLKVTKQLDPKKAKLPIPGFKITKGELGLEIFPDLKATGGIDFEAKVGKRPLLDGNLSFSANAQGFAAKGLFNAHIPGVDKAEGDVNYMGGVWSGGIHVEATQLQNKFKFVKSGSFDIRFNDAGVTAEGKVGLELPYAKDVEVGLKLSREGWILQGKGVFKHPRLTEIGIRVTHDGTNFEGEVNPGPQFNLLGFKGGLNSLKYRNGKFSGSGSLHFEKGKAKANLEVNFLETGKFTGKGDVSYQISENLLVTGAAELDAHEKLHLSGALIYTKPIEIPRTKFGGDKTLFTAGLSIPIPGLSLGPAVGLKARIEGELSAGFKIGPAQIRNIAIKAAFDPLDEHPNPEISGAAEFYMPGGAYISGSISAGIMLDAFIADVTGGLTVRVRADLDGHFGAAMKLTFTPRRYAFDANFELILALALICSIEAFLRARAGFGPFSASTSKKWTLAERKIDTGLQFGVRAPLHYASDEDFKAPSWDSLQFVKPQLDFGQLVDRALSSADKTQKEEK